MQTSRFLFLVGVICLVMGLLIISGSMAASPAQARVPTGFTPTNTPPPQPPSTPVPPPEEPPLLPESGEAGAGGAWAGFALALLGAGLVGLGLWHWRRAGEQSTLKQDGTP